LWIPLLSSTTENNQVDINHQNDVIVPIQSSILHFQNRILFIGGFIHDNSGDDEESAIADAIILDKIFCLKENDDTKETKYFGLCEVRECSLPHVIRGSSCCIYDGKLTVLGGLPGWNVNFSPSNDPWQLIDEYLLKGSDGNLNSQVVSGKWSSLPIRLPFDVILQGLAFSMTM
jgi:hypothetical protein